MSWHFSMAIQVQAVHNQGARLTRWLGKSGAVGCWIGKAAGIRSMDPAGSTD